MSKQKETTFRRPVAIAAVTELPPGRYPEQDSLGMYRLAVRAFLDEWKPSPDDIGGLMAPPAGITLGNAETLTHEKLHDELGLRPHYAETINTGGSTYSVMVQRAALAISAGLVDSVLCLGAGKFPAASAGGSESVAKNVSHPEFEFPYGPAIYAMYAFAATNHMAMYGTTAEQLARVAVSARTWAMQHPDALMAKKGAITIDDVLGSRPIASPFKMFDCSVPCEGGGAVLVSTEDIARKFTPSPAYVLGMGEYHTHGYISTAPDLTTMGSETSGALAYRMAGLEPQDIDVVELYDAFTINPIILLEDLKFCKKGEGGAFVQAGCTDPGGELPMNTYGGLLSYGHGGDASGLSLIVEGARQTMGLAGERQVPDAEHVLVHCYGGVMGEHATLILGRNP